MAKSISITDPKADCIIKNGILNLLDMSPYQWFSIPEILQENGYPIPCEPRPVIRPHLAELLLLGYISEKEIEIDTEDFDSLIKGSLRYQITPKGTTMVHRGNFCKELAKEKRNFYKDTTSKVLIPVLAILISSASFLLNFYTVFQKNREIQKIESSINELRSKVDSLSKSNNKSFSNKKLK